jgi:phosphate transport system substrate-binding protein
VLTLNKNNINDLYRTFSGFKDGLPTEKPLLSLFLNHEYEKKISENDRVKFEHQEVIPYARSGGSLTSGTAASFFEGSHFPNYSKGLTEAQKTAFVNGNYGKDFRLYDTDEANSRA